MAFSAALAERIRHALARKRASRRRRCSAVSAFLLNGNLLVGVRKDSLLVRLGPEQSEEALKEAHARAFDITGRPMKGWLLVEPEGVEEDDQLKDWIERATRFVRTLPAKEK